MNIVEPITTFESWARRYVDHMHALGRRFDSNEWIFGRLSHFLIQNESDDLDKVMFERWCATHHHMHANTSRAYQCVIRKLCLYRQRSEPECFVPDSSRFPRRRPNRDPVIIGLPEVKRLLQTVDNLSYHDSVPLRRATLRFAIVLLYTAGLRRGEVVHLMLQDIDMANGTVMIRDTKFFKSRLVPLSDDAQRELQEYLKQRLAPPWDTSPNAPLLGHQHNLPIFRAYSGAGFGRNIRKLLIAADVRDADGRLPTVHDFRYPNLNKIQTFFKNA